MLYARVEYKDLWAIIVILLTSMSYFDSAVLLDERLRPTLCVRLRETGSIDVLCIRWLAGVCLSHFSRNGFDEKGPYEG